MCSCAEWNTKKQAKYYSCAIQCDCVYTNPLSIKTFGDLLFELTLCAGLQEYNTITIITFNLYSIGIIDVIFIT